jgi:hypothetical protein
MPPSKSKPSEPKKKRSPIQHVRPYWNELNEASWIVTFPAEEKPPALRAVPIYGKQMIDSPAGAIVKFIGIDDEYRPNPRSCCPLCFADKPCPVWVVDPEGYERRKPHERVKLTPERRVELKMMQEETADAEK